MGVSCTWNRGMEQFSLAHGSSFCGRLFLMTSCVAGSSIADVVDDGINSNCADDRVVDLVA